MWFEKCKFEKVLFQLLSIYLQMPLGLSIAIINWQIYG